MSSLSSTAVVPGQAELEFDRQVDGLAAIGLAEHYELAEACFRAQLEPLRDLLPTIGTGGNGIPFVVVLPDLPVPAVLDAVHMVGGAGFTTMADDDVARFRPLPELDVPTAPYLLLDVDTGPDTLNLPPSEALPLITAAGRSPLTVAEGLAAIST
jgi:hypothetical protein